MSWDAHMDWVNRLFRAMMHEAPSNFNAVSLQQLVKADQEMFTLIASEFDGPLRAQAINGCPPLNAQVRMYMNDPRVEKRAAPPSSSGAPKQPPTKKPRSDAKPAAQVPTELQGLHSKTADNKPLCWNYNLPKSCSNATKKGRCRFGYHACMKCLKPGHGAHKCHSA